MEVAELVWPTTPEPDDYVNCAFPALRPFNPPEARLSPNFRLVAQILPRSVPSDPPPSVIQEIRIKLRRASPEFFIGCI